LDPRIKGGLVNILDSQSLIQLREDIVSEMVEADKKINPVCTDPTPHSPASTATLSSTEATSPNDLEIMVGSILGGNNSQRAGSDSDIRTQCENELSALERSGEFHLAFKLGDNKESCPLNWWKNNNGHYQRLAWLAIKSTLQFQLHLLHLNEFGVVLPVF